MISIVNYGVGNIGSVANMLSHIGATPVVASSIAELEAADALILPGVGAFDAAMQRLNEKGFSDVLRRRASEGTPLLGICLGMQLLSNGSEEGALPGLGLIDGDFAKFDFPQGSPLKVPHMGWNTVTPRRENPLLDLGEDEQRFYFVHSYFGRCARAEDVIATSVHGHEFVCAYGRGKILGTQFHPEKSHRFGMRLLQKFVGFAQC